MTLYSYLRSQVDDRDREIRKIIVDCEDFHAGECQSLLRMCAQCPDRIESAEMQMKELLVGRYIYAHWNSRHVRGLFRAHRRERRAARRWSSWAAALTMLRDRS